MTTGIIYAAHINRLLHFPTNYHVSAESATGKHRFSCADHLNAAGKNFAYPQLLFPADAKNLCWTSAAESDMIFPR